LKQKVCKLELESSYYERCTRSSNGRVWSLSSRTIGRMSEGCSLQTTTTDNQLFQETTIHAILPENASRRCQQEQDRSKAVDPATETKVAPKGYGATEEN